MNNEAFRHPAPEQAKPEKLSLQLDESRRPLLEAKLQQYLERLAHSTRDAGYRAPESPGWYGHYDSAAKALVAEAILTGDPVDQDSILDQMNNRYLQDGNLGDHRDLVKAAIQNALEVIDAYNNGNQDEVIGSQPV
ncbi:MAG: hypothetical protein AAB413_01995 [Patescibacteria group bacterium]